MEHDCIIEVLETERRFTARSVPAGCPIDVTSKMCSGRQHCAPAMLVVNQQPATVQQPDSASLSKANASHA